VVVVLIVVLAAVQLVRRVPSQRISYAANVTVTVPGSDALPWPASGEAAVSLGGNSIVRTSGLQRPVPIASLAKMMTALIVLRDHPLSGEDDGPSITITAADVTTYQLDVAAQDSVLPVQAGEVLTERQALEGLLLPSADNIADVLANWDAGSVSAFLTKMNATAKALGMTATTYTDPSGLAATTLSTALDQLRIETTAMDNPVFAAIVSLPSATFPVGGTLQNYDFDVGHDGIIGVKTGSDSAAQGCWAFAANRLIGGSMRPVYGVVLGIPSTSLGLLEPALSAGLALANAIPGTIRDQVVLPAGTVVGHVVAPWRSAVALRTTKAVSGLVLAGQTVTVHVTATAPSGKTVGGGTVVGSVSSTQVSGTSGSSVVTSTSGGGPSLWWRLTRF
jgi:serine-type D-Ala-D-Ala carboxypeptidase (penicillin-binding protein 5/6)